MITIRPSRWIRALAAAWLFTATARAQVTAPEPTVTPASLAQSAPDLPSGVSIAGAAEYALTIEAPPGRGGLAPDMKLLYSSHNRRDSLTGVGWTIGIPAIERNRRKGTRLDGNDFLAKAGSGTTELACVSGPDNCATLRNGNVYRSRIDSGAQSTYLFTDDHWIVYDRQGGRATYGANSVARLNDQTGTGVFAWNLETTEDASGHAVLYQYDKDSPVAGDYASAPPRLRQITYAARLNRSGFVVREGTAALVFEYDTRPTSVEGMRVSSYLACDFGFCVRHTLVLRRISVSSSVEYTKYELRYDFDGPGFAGGPPRLTSMQRLGKSGSSIHYDVTLPATTIRYAQSDSHTDYRWNVPGLTALTVTGDFDGDGRADIASGSSAAPTQWTVQRFTGSGVTSETWPCTGPALAASGFAVPGDFNADGITDIAWSKAGATDWLVSLSNGNGGFTSTSWSLGSYSLPASRSGLAVGDFDGDGATDVAFAAVGTPQWIVALSRRTSWQLNVWNTSDGLPAAVALDNKEVILTGDFNGDGRADIAQYHSESGRPWRVSLSTGTGFTTTTWGGPSTSVPWAVALMPIDINGDGLTDLAGAACGTHYNFTECISDANPWNPPPVGSEVQCATSTYAGCTYRWYLSTGSGFKLHSLRSSRPQYESFVSGDFDGDGRSEIAGFQSFAFVQPNATTQPGWVVEHPGGHRARLNTGGPTTLCGNDDWVFKQAVAVTGDFNGSGRTDVLRKYGTCAEAAVAVDSGSTPGVMSSVENGFGGTTSYEYRASSSFNRLAPSLSPVVNPGLPILTVRAISTDVAPSAPGDARPRGGLTTVLLTGSFTDVSRGEFRGFRKMTVDTPDGVRRITTFHQVTGRSDPAEDGDCAGKAQAQVTEVGGTALVRTDYLWHRSAPRGQYPVTIQLDTANSALGSAWSKRQYVYDTNHNVERVTLSGTGSPPVVTHFEYERGMAVRGDPLRESWNVSREYTVDAQGQVVRDERRTFYPTGVSTDGREGKLWTHTFVKSGTTGPTASLTYDSSGALAEVTDPAGGKTTYDYVCDRGGVLTESTQPCRIERKGADGIAYHLTCPPKTGRIEA